MNDKDLQHLAAIVRDSDDAIIGKTLEGIITSWNGGAERIYGYTAEEAIGRTVAMLVPSDREDELPEILQKLTQGQRMNNYGTLRVTKDGSIVNISLTVSPIRDASGAITGASTIGRDVTKEKEAEAALRESANSYKQLMEQASDAILVSYPDQPLLEVNQRASDMLGYTREELLQLRRGSSTPPDDMGALALVADEIIEGDIVYAERPVRRKDGTVIVTELSARRLDDGRILTLARDVTERKRAEEALAQSEKRLVEAQKLAHVGSWEWDLVSDEAIGSAEMLRLLGLQPLGGENRFTIQSFIECLQPEDREWVQQALAKAVEERGSINYENRIVSPDGTVRIIHGLGEVILDDAGQPVKMIGTARDITESKRAEEALRASEARLRSAIDLAQLSPYEWYPQTNARTWDVGVKEIWGLPPDTTVDTEIFLAGIHPDDREAVQAALNRSCDPVGGGLYIAEYRVIRQQDKQERWVSARGRTFFEGDVAVRHVGVAQDITELKQAEEALNESRARITGIVNSAMDAIISLDSDQRILLFNAAAERMFRCSADDVLGHHIGRLLPNRFRSVHGEHIREFGRTGVTERAMGPLRAISGLRADGEEFPVEASISQVEVAGRKVYSVILRDVTERKQAEEAVARSEAELRALFAAMTDVVLVLDAQGRYLQIAPTRPDLLYKPPAELLGRTIHEVLPAADADNILHRIQLALEKQHPVHIEYSLPIGDREIWFDGTVSPMGEDKVFWIARDITEHKQAQLELEQSEKRFRALIENSSDGITLVSANGMLAYASDSTQRILGYSPEELVGHDPMQMIHPDDQAAIGNLLVGLMERPEGSVTTEYRVRHKDGSWRWIESMINNMLAKPAIRALVFNYRDVTERKQSELAVQNSEKRFRALVEHNADAIILSNLEGIVLYASPAASQVLGTPLDELIGMNGLTGLHPDDFALVAQVMGELLQKPGASAPFEIRFQHRDGSWHWIEGTGTNLLDEPAVQAFVANYRDVTERKHAEESLRLSGEILQRVRSLVLVSGKDAEITYASPSVKTVLGYEPEELLGDGWWQHSSFDPEEGKREKSYIRDLAIPETVVSGEPYERRVKDKAGELHWILWQDVKGPDGLVIGVGHDITERKEADKSLRESEERFRLMFAGNPLPMWVYDVESLRFLEVNDAAVARYGYSREEFLSMRITDIRPVKEIPRLREDLERVRPAQQSSGEWRHQKKDGQIIDVQITSHTFTFGGHEPGKGAILVVAEDITERKRIEEARLAREAAEEASRAKSEFLSRMSHELRTPLNAILGFGQLLQMDDTTPEQQECVEYIIKAGQHLLSLINEVLDIARIEEGRLTISMEPVFVRDVVQESLDLVQNLAVRRDIEVKSDLEGMEGCYVMADRQRLQQVLLNLLANSIKYNHEGGVVNISCSQLSSESDGTQQHEDPQLPAKVRISVSDTGPGLSPDKVARLFTPFERLGAEQGEVEGTGLGLALSKHLMEAMGGAIGVESEEDKGCTFWVELSPADVQMPGFEISVTGPLFSIQVGEQARTMLYIEDNLSNLRLIERILSKRSDINLISAMQGQMGLDMAYEHRPDLILLDLHLPDMTGNEVLLRLQEDPRTASIPVVVLSADANPRQVDKLLKAGARAYLTKPLNVKQLLKVLEETPIRNLV
jgi:PAS domain S-box-containing protein